MTDIVSCLCDRFRKNTDDLNEEKEIFDIKHLVSVSVIYSLGEKC